MDSSATETNQGPEAVSELATLRRDVHAAEQRYLRLLADFENFRRRSSAAQKTATEAGRRDALRPLLTVLDALEQALAAGSSDTDFYQGVAATRRLFVSALRDAGADPIPTLGEAFDPRVHDAVATIASNNVTPGTVVREERSGWRLGSDLLRPAQVVVAAPAEATAR